MSSDVPHFKDMSLEQIPTKQIVEVDKEARQRYSEHFANMPRVYAERLSREEIERLLIVMPITVIRIKSKEEQPRYRVIAGLRTWAVVQGQGDIRKIPCLVLGRNSAALRDQISKTELITCQGLMRSETSDAEWVFAHDAIVDPNQKENDTGSPCLNSKELAAMLGKTEQAIKNWRNKACARKGKKGKT